MAVGGRVSFFAAFLSSALGTGLSRILGAVRDRFIAQLLGAGAGSDAFWTAWLIPGTMRRFVADEGLTGALIPAMAQAEQEEGPEARRALEANALGALLLANVVVIAVGILAAEPLVLVFAPTWVDDPDKLGLATTLTRWMMPFLGMVSVVSFLEGQLNYRGHFFTPKLAPGLVSAGFIVAALTLGGAFEEPVWALVVGLLLGGAAHVLVNVPPLIRRRGGVWPSFQLRDPRVQHISAEMGKVVLIGLLGQANIIVLRQIATALPDGVVTQYSLATRVVDLAQGMVAVAIGSALLPNVTASITAGDYGSLRDDLVGAFRLAAFLLLPAAVVLSLYGLPTTALWFRTGAFTMEAVEATAEAVLFMAPFMLALAAVNILRKVFYALGDRRSLLVVGAMIVALNAALGWALALSFGLKGLAATLSVTTWVQVVLYLAVLRRRLGEGLGLGALVVPYTKMGLCLVPVGGSLWLARGGADWTLGLTPTNVAVFLGGLVVAAGSYLVCAWLLGLHEVTRVVGRLAARFRR